MLSAEAWWLVTMPTDLRCGMDRLLLQAQAVLGRMPTEGEAFVCANRAGTRMKLLSVDRHGVWLAVRRLHQGRFVWPRPGEVAWTLSAEQFAWLCAGWIGNVCPSHRWQVRSGFRRAIVAAMDLSALDAIDDPQALRALARQLLAQVDEQAQAIDARHRLIDSRKRTISLRDTQIIALTAEIARLRRLQFSARTERMDPAQRALFEETMAADIAAVEAQLQAIQAEGEDTATTQARRKTGSPGRKPLPEHLEWIETRHEPESCHYPQCQGALVAMGEHVSEKLACKPLEFYVRRDVYAAQGWASAA